MINDWCWKLISSCFEYQHKQANLNKSNIGWQSIRDYITHYYLPNKRKNEIQRTKFSSSSKEQTWQRKYPNSSLLSPLILSEDQPFQFSRYPLKFICQYVIPPWISVTRFTLAQQPTFITEIGQEKVHKQFSYYSQIKRTTLNMTRSWNHLKFINFFLSMSNYKTLLYLFLVDFPNYNIQITLNPFHDFPWTWKRNPSNPFTNSAIWQGNVDNIPNYYSLVLVSPNQLTVPSS